MTSPVINGWKATHADYPSIVALSSPWSKSASCTGTLIEADTVITAAHCVSGPGADDTLVVYGADDVTVSDDKQAHRVYAIETHPDHTQFSCPDVWMKCPITDETAWNDVAIIVLRDPIKGATCAPILPKSRFEDVLPIGSAVRIAGYGQNWVDESSKLYAADVPVVLRTSHEIEIGLDEEGEPGACFGDSGGPAYVLDAGHIAVTGITSRSAFQATCGQGAVYTLPGAYIEWFAERSTHYRCMRDTGGACHSGEYAAPPACPPATSMPAPGLTKPADTGQNTQAPVPSGGDVIEDPGCSLSPDGPTPVFESIYAWAAGVMALVIGLIWLWRARLRDDD